MSSPQTASRSGGRIKSIRHQFRFDWVIQDVETYPGKCAVLVFAQDTVMRLRLKLPGCERGFEIPAQERHSF